MSTNPLHDQVAIVTGASRGIGRAIAFELGRRGLVVATVARGKDDVNKPATIHRTAQVIEEGSGTALAVAADVRDEAQSTR